MNPFIKKLTLFLLIVSSGVLIAVFFAVQNRSPQNEKPKKAVSTSTPTPEPAAPSTDTVVARLTVTGLQPVEITRADIIRQKVFMDSAGATPASNKQAMEAIIRNFMLYREAIGRGVAMSRDDAVNAVRAQRQMFLDGTLPDSAQIQTLIAALQVDPDTYWKDIAPERYRQTISQFRLRQALTLELASTIPPGNEDRINMLYDSWVKSVEARGNLRVLDRPFLEEVPKPQMIP